MKTRHIDLEEIAIGGIGSAETRYKIDGKRATAEEFRELKRKALSPGGKLECLSNAQVNGVWYFYSVAVIPVE